MKIKALNSKQIILQLIRGVLLLAIVATLPLPIGMEEHEYDEIFFEPYIHLVSILLLFTVGHIVHSPKIFWEKKDTFYVLGLMLLVFSAMGFLVFLEWIGVTPIENENETLLYTITRMPGYCFTAVLILALMFGVSRVLFKSYAREIERRSNAEKEQVKTEMAFLKMQLNPHFLFNKLKCK